MQRKLLIAGLILIILLVVAATGALLLYRFLRAPLGYEPATIPSELSEPRVVIGDSFLARSQFLDTNQSEIIPESSGSIGLISEIRIGELDPHPGLDIVIAGSTGAIVVDQNGVRQSQILYELETVEVKTGPFEKQEISGSIGDLQIIDVEGDGVCEYLARGGLDGAALFNHHGKRLWTFGKETENKRPVRNVTAADLNGDDIAEFIASWEGIEAFDLSGKKLWANPEKFSPLQIEVVDIGDGSGERRIVSIEMQLVIRDQAGKELRSIDTPAGYIGRFSLCAMPKSSVQTILAVNNGYLWLIDFKGNAMAQFNAPLSEFPNVVEQTPYGRFPTTVDNSKGVWVRLVKDQPEYLAVIAAFSRLERSLLYIYEPSGNLVYQEVLPGLSSTIAVLPSETPGVSQLLIGGSGPVWRYTPK